MAWVSLIVAGVFEMFWATMMKLSEGFSKMNYSLLTIIGMIASFYFLSKSLLLVAGIIGIKITSGH